METICYATVRAASRVSLPLERWGTLWPYGRGSMDRPHCADFAGRGLLEVRRAGAAAQGRRSRLQADPDQRGQGRSPARAALGRDGGQPGRMGGDGREDRAARHGRPPAGGPGRFGHAGEGARGGRGGRVACAEAVVKTDQPGAVARLRVDLGDSVTQGKVLAEYDAREFQLAVDQADADLLSARQSAARGQATVASSEASLRRVKDGLSALQAEVSRNQSQVEWSKSELDRTSELFKKELIAQRDVDNARNGYNAALAQLQVAQNVVALHPDQVRIAEAQLDADGAALQVA